MLLFILRVIPSCIHILIKKKVALSLSRLSLLSRRTANSTPLTRRHVAQVPLSSMSRVILQRLDGATGLLVLDPRRQPSKALSNP